MQTNWTWKDLFDERFRIGVWKKVSRFARSFIRISIMLGIFYHFFVFGFVPSDSMYPTLQTKDFVLYKRTNLIERGDIILFNYPLAEETLSVKRAIGLPGDTVEIKDGKIYVNEEVWDADYMLSPPMFTYEKVQVPEGHYFVLGDNINVSVDSVSYGFIDEKDIKGKAVAVLLPFQRFHIFH